MLLMGQKPIRSLVGFLVLAAIFRFITSFLEIRSIAVSRSQSTRDIKPLYSNLTSSFLFSKDDIDFKPTTQISEKKCDAIPSQPLKTIASFRNYEHIENLTELTSIHGDSETPLAICKYVEEKHTRHFPHVMQHLYMCYSFWLDNPSRVPVLYHTLGRNGKEKMIQFFSKNPFLEGFTDVLISQLEVEIFDYNEIIDWLKANMTKTDAFLSFKEKNTSMTTTDTFLSSKYKNDNLDFGSNTKEDESYNGDDGIHFRFHEMRSPIGYVLSHVDILNQMVQQHFDFGEGKRNEDSTSIEYVHESTTQCPSPRIGILNRKRSNGRSITNADSLVHNITSELFFTSGSDNNITLSSTSPDVSLTYFEGQTFEQQVRFFRNIDLLISPHGAQLTGIPFMANKPCTKMIELFPHNYLLPDYFGTLARDSGIEYSYIYVSESSADTIQQAQTRSEIKGRIVPPITFERVAARGQNLCISTAYLVDTLRDAIRNWCKCKQ
jgi:hypothetical protein